MYNKRRTLYFFLYVKKNDWFLSYKRFCNWELVFGLNDQAVAKQQCQIILKYENKSKIRACKVYGNMSDIFVYSVHIIFKINIFNILFQKWIICLWESVFRKSGWIKCEIKSKISTQLG